MMSGSVPTSTTKATAVTGAGFLHDGSVSPIGQETAFALAESVSSEIPSNEILDHMKVQLMVRAYQVRGHHLANLDPLGISQPSMALAPELSYKNYGFSEADLDRKFCLGQGILYGFSSTHRNMTLREILETLQSIYCGSIGLEYAHIPGRTECNWLRQRVEIPQR